MWSKLIRFIALLFFAATLTAKMELQMERIEQELGFETFNLTGFRVKKYNRSTWVLDGVGELFVDFGNDYSFTISAAFSRMGNNQFNNYPLKIAKNKICNVLNGPYKEYQHYFLNWTNMPTIGDEWFCPLPKGLYWAKDFAPDSGWIPPTTYPGYWRLTFEFYDSHDTVVVKFVEFMRVINSMV